MFLSFNATQWVFTTVSLANLLWFFWLGSGPVGCLLRCFSYGKTQIWLGDLRLALVSLVCVSFVLVFMICQASCDHRRPCRSFLTNSFDSSKDRALERDRPSATPEEKKKETFSHLEEQLSGPRTSNLIHAYMEGIQVNSGMSEVSRDQEGMNFYDSWHERTL